MSIVTAPNKHMSQKFVNNILNIPAEERANSESNKSSANSTGAQPNKKPPRKNLFKVNVNLKADKDYSESKYT